MIDYIFLLYKLIQDVDSQVYIESVAQSKPLLQKFLGGSGEAF